jgi:predicted Na+-dependent transporter
LIGFYIGKFVGDMYKFSWDKEKEKVISQIDALGIVVFIIYILFAIGKYWIFGHFLSGNILGVVVVSITAGCMLGRMHSTRNGIHEALEVTGIIKK